MGRNIFAAIGGYIVMVIIVMASIGTAWAMLGGAGAFNGEGPMPSTAWLASNLISGFVAASVAGWATRTMGTTATAVHILIAFIFMFGILSAAMADTAADRQPLDKPVADLTFMEAGGYAVQPTWYNWVIPVVGVAGVWLGGRQKGSA